MVPVSISLIYSAIFFWPTYNQLKFRVTYHRNRNNKVVQETVLSSALQCFLTLWGCLNDLHALVDGAQHNRFERSALKVFVVVNFVQNVESNYSLALGQQVAFEEIADSAACLKPLVTAEFMVELLEALLECLLVAAEDIK
mgnify:FL=1